MRWSCLPFSELAAELLYEALALRQSVFVVEQRCAYLDADGKDARALHLFGREGDGPLLAYARLFLPGALDDSGDAVIGRVVSAQSARRTGAGKALMREAIRELGERAPGVRIRIGAQLYLLRFYQELGFVRVGDVYDEDGIDHVVMYRS
jgi:ElaA protein